MKFSVKFLFFLVVLTLACNKGQQLDDINEEEVPEQLTDEELLDLVQEQTFNYFWEGAEPNSGMARERIHIDEPQLDQDVITTGGSGFGLMTILIGIKRGFISREEGLERFEKVINFLETADRFHGVWPHWLNGKTGKVIPFSPKDDGGDLVETAFLVQGLLTVSEYFKNGNTREKGLVFKIEKLWEDVEWNWYTKNNEDVLYWHWSPNFGWEMNFKLSGYNEALITYVLAAASPTYAITKEVYEKGWAKNGEIVSTQTSYELPTILGHNVQPVGPLFWAHYSYLGLNPTNLKDQYADYWAVNQNHAKIIYRYCVDNPKNFEGYGEVYWGLTASYSINGYAAHSPSEDLGVISPTAALSSFPYTPEESMRFLRALYEDKKNLIGKYGPYDAYSLKDDWYVTRYLAIDQGPIPVMIENYRSQLIWNLFMENEAVQKGLSKLGFSYE
jgi:hypothetical protein